MATHRVIAVRRRDFLRSIGHIVRELAGELAKDFLTCPVATL
jgi:hypothetical protein